MTSLRWSLDQVADFLGVSIDEVRDLVEAGFLHYEEITDRKSFDAAAVKDWRRGLDDGGSGGAAYVRELLRTSAVQHA